MREHVLVYDTGGGIKEVEVNQGIRRISGSSSLSTLESHLAEHSAILGTSYNLVSNEFIRVRDEGGGLREVPVTPGVQFIRSDSNKVTLDGHVLEHTALAADTPLAVTSNEYVLVYNTGGGSRQVPVVDGCLFIEGERYLSTYSDHFNIHTTTGLPPGLDLPAIGRTLFAPLKSSLVLAEGTGSPTFSRATKAWRLNELGYLRDVPSGCAVFEGARLVRNLCVTKSEDFTNAAWAKTALTAPSANLLVCANSTTSQFVLNATSDTTTIGDVLYFRYRVQYVDIRYVAITPHSGSFGSGIFCNFDLVGKTVSATGCTGYITEISPNVFDIAIRATATLASSGATATLDLANSLASPRKDNFIGDGVKSIGVLRYSANYVTGYDASYIPEYVSVGVASSPFFGAGVDGAKYYETDWQGAPIPAASLLGFRREPAATNNVRFARNLYGSTFAELGSSSTPKVWEPSTTGSSLVTNGTFDTDLTGWTNNGSSSASVVSEKLRIDSTGGNGGRYQDLTLTIGKTYYISADVTLISGSGTMLLTIYGSASFSGEVKQTWLFSTGSYGTIFKATTTTHRLYLSVIGTLIADFDNVVVKECTCVPSLTATGLDSIANTATTLTAIAADAIILQPITLASAARCASAYVKRTNGTGTISFTQDGGSTWTDITSQINSSTYSRVQITSTLANPSVGFKISTSGDAIDVDVVQNEAGSVATSPIVTTTTTVTRNADSLSYQTASNWSDTAGTAFVEVAPLAYSGGAIGSATNGLLLSTSNSGATAYDGTNSANGPSGTPGSSEKLAFRWGSSAMTVSSGGVIGTPGTYDGGMGLSSIGVGSSAAGCFKNAAIYNYAMTDAELQAVTA